MPDSATNTPKSLGKGFGEQPFSKGFPQKVFFLFLLILITAPALAQQQTGTVTAKTLNVRSAPSIDTGAILATLTQGDTVTILKENKEWLKVQTTAGVVGWAAAVYIDTGEDSRDPEQILSTAEAIFDNSFKIEKTSSGDSSEQYKVYNTARVLDALELVEKAIHNPGLKALDRAFFLRGRCKTVIGWYALQFKQEFFKTNAQDYDYNEVGMNYIYRGGDFRTLLEKFPKSELADDAAFEIANLPRPGECEGDPECNFERALLPFEKFLSRFPSSPLTARAIELINSQGIDSWLDSQSLTAPPQSGAFDRKAILKLVDRYLAAVKPLNTPGKAAALHPIADAYAALGRTDSATTLYKKIIADFPNYEHLDHVKTSLAAIKNKK